MTLTTPELILCEVTIPNESQLLSYSPFCEKIHRALRFAKLPYTRNHGTHPGAFKQYNPLGKVPVLLVDGQPICDSTRILQWILAHRTTCFHVGWTPKQEAEAWLWEEFGDTILNGFVIAARWADPRNWPRLKQEFFGKMPIPLRLLLPGPLRKGVLKNLRAREVWTGDHDACWLRFDEVLAQLELRAPADGFWCGDTLSVADLSLFSQLNAFRSQLTPWQRERVEAQPKLFRYMQRVDASTTPAQSLAKAA